MKYCVHLSLTLVNNPVEPTLFAAPDFPDDPLPKPKLCFPMMDLLLFRPRSIQIAQGLALPLPGEHYLLLVFLDQECDSVRILFV